MSQQLYSASEARKRLGGMASSSFHRLVEKGEIRKVTPTGKTHGMYIKEDVEKLAREYSAIGLQLPSTEQPKEEGATSPKIVIDWRRRDDLPAMLSLDMEVYKDEVIGRLDIYHAWWQKNPKITLLAFEEGKRETILANVTLLPLPEKTILEILKGELGDAEIPAKEIETYDHEGEYSLLAENAITRPGPNSKDYLGMIINKFAQFWCEQWPKLKIRRIYAEAGSSEGRYLVQKLYFGPLYDISDDAYVLDLRHENPSKFISRFQDCIREKEKALHPDNPELLITNKSKWFRD